MGLISGMQLSLNGQPIVLVLGFAMFYAALHGAQRNLKQSLWYSFFFGYGFFLWSHGWISQPLTSFGDLFKAFEIWVFLGIPVLGVCFFLVMGFLNAVVWSQTQVRVFILSLAVCCLEYVRCYVFPAVPLGQIGTVWINTPYIPLIAAFVGLSGLSFVTYYVSFSLGELFLGNKTPVVLAGVMALFLGGLGFWHAQTPLEKSDVYVRLVPTSWPQVEKYGPIETRVQHLNELILKSTRQVKSLTHAPSLIVWPETTIEFSLLQHAQGYNFIYPEIKPYLQQHLFKEAFHSADLLAGVGFRINKDIAYNVAMVMNVDDIQYVYKKHYLAQFGEFTPGFLKPLFRLFNIPMMSEYTPGECAQPVYKGANLNIRSLICYEASYSRTIRHTHEPIDLLVVITNDAWFGLNGKQQQFMSHVFRAIEEGIPMVRCANSGYSGYVLPNGAYAVSLTDAPLDIQIHKSIHDTVFSRLTWWFRYWVEVCVLLLIALGVGLELCFRKRYLSKKI